MSNKPIHLPYNQYDAYWICILPKEEIYDQGFKNKLTTLGFTERGEDQRYHASFAGKHWGELWAKLRDAASDMFEEINVAIIAGEDEPDQAQISFSHKPATEIDQIYQALWLGDAVLNNEVVCHLQPVMSKDSRVVGHESFARVVQSDGKVIGGGDIIEASRNLGIEYALDRYLHVQAIKTFMQGGLNGYLFVNFFPGFIQRPEVYLEGLTEAVRMHSMISKQVVLDFTESEHEHDMDHMKRVTDFCRSKGYAIALDDVASIDNAKKLIPEVRPDFVKLARRITAQSQRSSDLPLLRDIVDLSHNNGAVVIGEGVEDEEVFTVLKQLDVDMFQGYLFSAPVEIKPADTQAAAGQ